MTRIDQFESVFKSASKTVYSYEEVTISKAIVVTDLSEYEARLFGDRVRAFLEVLGDEVSWRDVTADECSSVGALLDLVEQERPDLVCTYRHLHSGAWRWPYGLGEHLDVLTQVTTTPVLVLPRPDDEALARLDDTDSVMAMTSQLSGDHHLVSAAVRFTEPQGRLCLTHIEDEAIFERYMEVIAKIPSIDTDAAREQIGHQLIKDARDFIRSCRDELQARGMPLTVEKIVTLGHHLADHKRLLSDHSVDLLVINTKDDDQLAMHGLAYPLAVELRDLPILML